MRHREGHDGATPSANAVAAHALARLSYHLGRDDLREEAAARAARLRARDRAPARARSPRACSVVDLLLEGPVELAFVGRGRRRGPRGAAPRGGPPLPAQPHRRPPRSRRAGAAAAAAAGRQGHWSSGRAALYVCRDFACQRPVTDPAEVAAALARRARRRQRRAPARSRRGAGRRRDARRARGAYAARAARRPRPATRALGAHRARVQPRSASAATAWTTRRPRTAQALRQALRAGCNLIDTSTNYTDGGSERLVGPGPRRARPRRRRWRARRSSSSRRSATCRARTSSWPASAKTAGGPIPDMVKYGEGIWHCIHPEFLADQLTRSLARLRARDARRLPAAQPRVLPDGRARAQLRHAREAARGVLPPPGRGLRATSRRR